MPAARTSIVTSPGPGGASSSSTRSSTSGPPKSRAIQRRVVVTASSGWSFRDLARALPATSRSKRSGSGSGVPAEEQYTPDQQRGERPQDEHAEAGPRGQRVRVRPQREDGLPGV